MFESLWKDLKYQYDMGGPVTRIVFYNVIVWLIVGVVGSLFTQWEGYNTVLHWITLSSDPIEVLWHPWTIITYNFVHLSLFHILFNMLIFYWFGAIVSDFIGRSHIWPLYILGGISGGVMYLLFAHLLNYYGSYALGASASVTAILVTAGMIVPNYEIKLILIGNVKIKYIVLAVLVFDLISIGGQSNTGGHVAHLGGAIFGWYYVWMLRQGHNISHYYIRWTNYFKSIYAYVMPTKKPKPKRTVFTTPNPERVIKINFPTSGARKMSTKEHKSGSDSSLKSHEEKLNEILDRINEVGYENLTDDERSFLRNASKK